MIRTSKTINNVKTEYYVEGTSIIFEKTGNDVLYYIRNEVDGLVGFKYNDATYYYIKNNQNDIIAILDNLHNYVAKYTYDAWGNIISITDSDGNDVSNDDTHIGNINPFRYRSYYYDKETNLYYLNSRYYNPVWGRFINADSYGGEIGGNILSHNTYAYTLNNPINNIDINGNFVLPFLIPFAKAVFGAALAYGAYVGTKKAVETVAVGITDAISNPYYNPPKLDIKTKEDTKTDVDVKPIVPYAPSYEESKPCTTAKFNPSKTDIITGKRLTIGESQTHVELGGNVICDNKNSALSVAIGFGIFIGPEIDKNKKPNHVYYWHYHPDRDSHRHIWFYGNP